MIEHVSPARSLERIYSIQLLLLSGYRGAFTGGVRAVRLLENSTTRGSSSLSSRIQRRVQANPLPGSFPVPPFGRSCSATFAINKPLTTYHGQSGARSGVVAQTCAAESRTRRAIISPAVEKSAISRNLLRLPCAKESRRIMRTDPVVPV